MKKKLLLSIFLVIIALFNTLSVGVYAGQNSNPFDDVNEESWYYDPVIYAYENGIMAGINENVFLPHGELSRAMTVQMLYSVAGKPDDGISWGVRYDDVSENSWYFKAVVWANQNGITDGIGNNKFAPDMPVTRADLCVMLLKYAGCSSLKLPEICEAKEFADAAKIPDYAHLAVSILNQAEIVSGKPGNLFDPKGKATRAEAAVMFSALIKKAEKQSFDLLAQHGFSFSGLFIEADHFDDRDNGQLGFGIRYEQYFDCIFPDKIDAVITTKQNSFKMEVSKGFSSTTIPIRTYTYLLCKDIGEINSSQGETIVLDITVYYGQESETYTLYLEIPYALNDYPFDV